MEWGNWLKSLAAVYAFLAVSGMIITLIGSQVYCSKISFTASLKQGFLWSFFPVVIYGLATYFTKVRTPFSNVFKRWILRADEQDVAKVKLMTERSEVYGVGYLVMLSMWIIMIIMIGRANKEACEFDLEEASKFKKDLLAQLQKKQEEEEKEKEKAEKK